MSDVALYGKVLTTSTGLVNANTVVIDNRRSKSKSRNSYTDIHRYDRSLSPAARRTLRTIDNNNSLSVITLPYDVLLNISLFLGIRDLSSLDQVCTALHEFVRTRTVWRNYAVGMLDQCKPLKMEGFQRIIDLDAPKLTEAIVAGARLRDRWSTQCPQLKQPPTFVETITDEEIIWQSPITSKHVLCCTKTGKVLCWEVLTGKKLTELDAGEEWEIWKCRIEFDERTVFFAMAKREKDEEVDGDNNTECQIMSLTFPADSNGDLTGIPVFSLLSRFSFPGPVISVYILDPFRKLLSAYIWLKDTQTLGLYALLDWTKLSSCFLDTGIDCKSHQELACIGYDPCNVVIHSEDTTNAYQFFYPITLLEDLSTDSSTTPIPKRSSYKLKPKLVPPPRKISHPFILDAPQYKGYTSQSSNFVRQWWPSLPTSSNDIRKLSCTVLLLAHSSPPNQNGIGSFCRYTLAQHYFSVPIRANQLRRWYLPTPFEIVRIMSDGSGLHVDSEHATPGPSTPLIAVDFGHAVWLEYVIVGGSEKHLRFVAFPHVDVDRMSDGFDAESAEVRTLEVPKNVDMNTICHVGLDQAQGAVILGLRDGKIAILHYE